MNICIYKLYPNTLGNPSYISRRVEMSHPGYCFVSNCLLRPILQQEGAEQTSKPEENF